ncbi:MAG: hypothetical protein IJL45_05585 [Prevotella sp.]|nr:hypothetical protein [Prevotella sp.]
MEELEALTDEVYTEELKRHKGEKYSSSVLMVTQRMLYGKKTGEFSRRLYRCDITIGQKLYDAIMKKETEK